MRLFKVLGLAAVCLVALSAAAPAWAGKVGFVDLQKVLDLTTTGKQISQEIQTRTDAVKIEIKKLELKFVTMRDDFEKNQAVLADEAKQAKLEELQKAYVELETAKQKKMMEIEGYKLDQFKVVIAKVKEITNKLAQEQGYDIVLLKVEDVMTEGSVVLYGAASVDLTDQVIRQMNQ